MTSETKEKEVKTSFNWKKNAFIPLAIGSVFGLAFQLGHINEFYFMRNQFRLVPTSDDSFITFKTTCMLKMFLGAALSSLIVMHIFSILYSKKFEQLTSWATFKPYRGVLSTTLGCFLIGMAMYLCASCPGTVYTQIGSGSTKAIASWLGGLFGNFIYYFIDSISPNSLKRFLNYGKFSEQNRLLYQSLKITRQTCTIILTILLICILIWTEISSNWKNELKEMYLHSSNDPKEQYRWQTTEFKYEIIPTAAGILIGLLQIPLFLYTNHTLGTSGSYSALLSQIIPFWNKSEQLNRARKFGHWQIATVIGIIVMSYIWVLSTGNWFVGDQLISYTEAFIGGILFGIGSRLAGGCTSGIGITSFSLLSNAAILGTCAMFGGGIFLALIY